MGADVPSLGDEPASATAMALTFDAADSHDGQVQTRSCLTQGMNG